MRRVDAQVRRRPARRGCASSSGARACDVDGPTPPRGDVLARLPFVSAAAGARACAAVARAPRQRRRRGHAARCASRAAAGAPCLLARAVVHRDRARRAPCSCRRARVIQPRRLVHGGDDASGRRAAARAGGGARAADRDRSRRRRRDDDVASRGREGGVAWPRRGRPRAVVGRRAGDGMWNLSGEHRARRRKSCRSISPVRVLPPLRLDESFPIALRSEADADGGRDTRVPRDVGGVRSGRCDRGARLCRAHPRSACALKVLGQDAAAAVIESSEGAGAVAAGAPRRRPRGPRAASRRRRSRCRSRCSRARTSRTRSSAATRLLARMVGTRLPPARRLQGRVRPRRRDHRRRAVRRVQSARVALDGRLLVVDDGSRSHLFAIDGSAKAPVNRGGEAALFDYAHGGPCFGSNSLIIGAPRAR